jgi:hypothetical protein
VAPITDDTTLDPIAQTTDDAEGHSFGGAILGSTLAGSAGRPRTQDKRPSDEALPPLTKPFPRMREDKTK